MDLLLLRRLARGAGLAVLGGALLLPAGTEDPEPTRAPAPESYYGRPTAPTGGLGMRVFLDEDGRPTTPPPNAANVSVIRSITTQQALARAGEPAREIDAPGGGKLLRLDDQFKTYSVARVAADGSLTVTCERPEVTHSSHAGIE